jgi:transcriptional regulator with PAS, ATPase and Fis domain
MIDYAMITYDGNKTRVAKQLGISRQHLYKPAMKELASLDEAE